MEESAEFVHYIVLNQELNLTAVVIAKVVFVNVRVMNVFLAQARDNVAEELSCALAEEVYVNVGNIVN